MAGEPEQVAAAFAQRFPAAPAPALYRAPGRVNLIGEHTDYTLGYVLPIALEMACYTAFAPANDGVLEIFSVNLGEAFSMPAAEVAAASPRRAWTDYVIGVAVELHRLGIAVPAGSLLIDSRVPTGAGLSSSAALEVATALALAGDTAIAPLDLINLCHRAENSFVGMPCGVMDQSISVLAQEGSALLIDCRDRSTRAAPLPAGTRLLAVNTMVKHELGSSAYRERVSECRQALETIQARHPEVLSLRDAKTEHLSLLEGKPLKRARHIVGENRRVLDFIEAAERGDLAAMGRLIVESHKGLSDDFEVSCEELDFLAEKAIGIEGVLGARMMGGGFGGCTINLMLPDAEEGFRERITEAYQAAYGITPDIFVCIPSRGAGRVG